MRLEDMLKNVSGITNKVIKENCWEGQFNVLEGVQTLQSKINEIIVAINNGIIKGDKGDTPNVQVGETTTLDPNSKAIVTQTGDILNPILNFGIPKGDKGDKGDTGKASESIQDNVVGLDTCWSSEKTVGYVDNMFNSLQDVKGVKYETDSNYKVMIGTKNGVVKDLKISGRSLVNYGEPSNIYETTADRLVVKLKNKDILTNSQITFVNFSDKMMNLIIFDSVTNSYKKAIDVKVGVTKVDISNTEKIDNVVGLYSNGWKISDKDTIRSKYVMLIGDYTQNPPSYFEGIASVGNGNEIEVLSLNPTINYKDKYDSKIDGSYYFYKNGTKYDVSNMSSYNFKNNNYDVIKLVGNYTSHITFFNGNSFISGKLLESPLFDEIIKVPSNCTEIRVGCRNDLVVPNIYLKQDKKPILFKDTDGAWKPVTELRGIDLNSCDTIENGKYSVKTNKIVLNGEGDYYLSTGAGTQTNTIMLGLRGVSFKKPTDDKLKNHFLCSNANQLSGSQTWNDDIEGVSLALNGIIFIRLSKSKATDLVSAKEYLKNNPIPLIYLMNEVKEYEVNPLDLESFENETMILFKYGVINGLSQFYVDSNLGSITLDNINRLSRLENEVFQVKKLILNGDYRTLAESTYPNDFKEVNNE